jgi:hypothetical protein
MSLTTITLNGDVLIKEKDHSNTNIDIVYDPNIGVEYFHITTDDLPKLQIPNWVTEYVEIYKADELEEELAGWLYLDSSWKNIYIFRAYMNPLTRPFVEVVEE